jgi:hypothetical protein
VPNETNSWIHGQKEKATEKDKCKNIAEEIKAYIAVPRKLKKIIQAFVALLHLRNVSICYSDPGRAAVIQSRCTSIDQHRISSQHIYVKSNEMCKWKPEQSQTL